MEEAFTLQDIEEGLDGYFYEKHRDKISKDIRHILRNKIIQFIRAARSMRKRGEA